MGVRCWQWTCGRRAWSQERLQEKKKERTSPGKKLTGLTDVGEERNKSQK